MMSKTITGRRVFQHALTLATTLLACAALQAVEHDEKSGNKAEKFIQKAAQGGQMEVQMAQMAQQRAQNQEVKSLAATLVKDHTEANQKLQQLAQKKNIQVSQQADQKHQGHLNKLRTQSGAEFDKEFVKNAIKHHKKSIAEFEKCSKDLTDPELKAFIDETLPKLRQHLQMAQSAARSVGVDEASITADFEADDDSAVGAPAGGVRGEAEIKKDDSQKQSDQIKSNSDASARPQSSLELERRDRLNGVTESDSSLTVRQNNPSATIDADADLDVDRDDASISANADVDVDKDGNKVFQKGDGKVLGIEAQAGDNKVLGLSTDKSDGKYLGIIPKPGNKDSEATVEAEIDRDSSGAPGAAESGSVTSSQRVSLDQAPAAVKQAIRAEGGQSTATVKKMTVYETEVNGKTIHVTEDGKVYKHGEQSK